MSFPFAPAPSPPSQTALSDGLSGTTIALLTLFAILLFFCRLVCGESEDVVDKEERRKREKRVTINRILDRVASMTYMFYKPGEKGMESCSACSDTFEVGDECRVFIQCGHVYHEACTQDKFCPLCLGSSHASFVRIPALEQV